MTQFINVHTFDGKLKGIFKPYAKHSINDKKNAFILLLQKQLTSAAKQTIQTIINDLSIPNSNNYQQENNLDSSDILMDLIPLLDNTDLLPNLNEQLTDCKNLGICPSGRTTRLLQLWSAFH